ncbi:Lipase_GDSL domain-containing protein, partial [Psidium guajava]
SLDTSPSFGGGSSSTDDPPVASQHGSTEDADQEPSLQATMESLPPIQTLDNNLPDYDSCTSFNLQHYAYGDGQGNDFW